MQPHFLRHLVLMELADRMGGELHGFADLGIKGLFRSIEIGFGGGNFRSFDRCLVEVAGKARQSFITLSAHRSDNRADFRFESGKIGLGALLEFRPLFRRELCQFVEVDLWGHDMSIIQSEAKGSAIDGKADAGDVAGSIGAQENAGADEIIQFAEALHGDIGEHGLLPGGVLIECFRERRAEISGLQRIDPNAQRCPFHRQRPRHATRPVLDEP